MKINWKIRLKNKAFLLSLLSVIVVFVYQILGLFGVVPSITEDKITQVIGLVLNVLVALGIIIDPTSEGVNDCDSVLGCSEQKK